MADAVQRLNSDAAGADVAERPGDTLVSVVRAIARAIRSAPASNIDALAAVTIRALQVVDVVSEALINIRVGAIPYRGELLGRSTLDRTRDLDEITNYLVDPYATEDRLDELRAKFADLVTWEVLPLAPAGHA